jgi:hypothetical protein
MRVWSHSGLLRVFRSMVCPLPRHRRYFCAGCILQIYAPRVFDRHGDFVRYGFLQSRCLRWSKRFNWEFLCDRARSNRSGDANLFACGDPEWPISALPRRARAISRFRERRGRNRFRLLDWSFRSHHGKCGRSIHDRRRKCRRERDTGSRGCSWGAGKTDQELDGFPTPVPPQMRSVPHPECTHARMVRTQTSD